MIPSKVMAKLATMGLSEEQAVAVASMLTEVEEATAAQAEAAAEITRSKARARVQKWRDTLAMSASDWSMLRAAVLERDHFTCVYCGAKGSALSPLHVDHVIPLSRGGSNDPANLATACRECNCGKRDMTPEEWRA